MYVRFDAVNVTLVEFHCVCYLHITCMEKHLDGCHNYVLFAIF